jgi:hypothetical protein
MSLSLPVVLVCVVPILKGVHVEGTLRPFLIFDMIRLGALHFSKVFWVD